MAKENKEKEREVKPVINTNSSQTTLGAEIKTPKDNGHNKGKERK
jgi:hypothetical protein